MNQEPVPRPIDAHANQSHGMNANPQPPSSPRGVWWTLAVIILAGAVLRLTDLDRAGYMIDEINVIRDALAAPGYAAIIEREIERFTTWHRLPLPMLLIRAAAKALPFSTAELALQFPVEWVARLPFALLGIATIPLLWLLGRLFRDSQTGLWAAFLGSISVFHVFYSREAYDYALLIFASTAFFVAWLAALREFEASGTLPPRAFWTLAISGTLLIHSHLSGLLLIAAGAVVALAFLQFRSAQKAAFQGPSRLRWLAVFGLPALTFVPFLVRLLDGFDKTEWYLARAPEWSAPVHLLGRMGFGESAAPLLAFTLLVLAGLGALAFPSGRPRATPQTMLLAACILSTALQFYFLRVSRFEIRYFSPAFPVLILLAGCGADACLSVIRPARSRLWAAAPSVVAALIFLLAAPSLRDVIRLEARGWNYKGLSRWINANLPEGAVYAYPNPHYARGTPAVYATPGRFPSFAPPWNSPEEFNANRVLPWMDDFFAAHPDAALVEICPEEIYAADATRIPRFPREKWFSHTSQIEDPAWRRLVAARTHPGGDVQPEIACSTLFLASFNRRTEIPDAAARNGRAFYALFDSGWRYGGKDNQINDWWVAESGAILLLGSLSTNTVRARLQLTAVAQPVPATVKLLDPAGKELAPPVTAGTQPGRIAVGPFQLAPGESAVTVHAEPTVAGQQSRLLVHRADVEPAP